MDRASWTIMVFISSKRVWRFRKIFFPWGFFEISRATQTFQTVFNFHRSEWMFMLRLLLMVLLLFFCFYHNRLRLDNSHLRRHNRKTWNGNNKQSDGEGRWYDHKELFRLAQTWALGACESGLRLCFSNMKVFCYELNFIGKYSPKMSPIESVALVATRRPDF